MLAISARGIGVSVLVLELSLNRCLLKGTPVGGSVRDGTRDALRRLIDVELLLDGLGNRLDLGPKFLLDLVQVEAVIPVDQVDG